MQAVVHPIAPIYDARSRILILGSFPSPRSRQVGSYYGHPQNRFWPVLAQVLGEPVPIDHAARTELLLRRQIAMWDVLRSCQIEGADDSSIVDAVPNDLSPIFRTAQIRAVFTTGRAASRLYALHCAPVTGLAAHYLPSTSAANRGRYPFERLVVEYRQILPYLEEPDEPHPDRA